jgi:hypothetical protein
MNDEHNDAEFIGTREVAEALDPDVGDGTPETAPAVLPPPPSLLDREPWLVALALALLPAIGSLVQALVDGEPLRAAISAFVAVAIPIVIGVLRSKTTPVADPKIDEDVRLIPDV